MNVLSLFDGMSCGQIALSELGIKYENYFASEIDESAIKVTQANFPNTIQLGDITKIKSTDLPKIDIIFGGSPCQGFSFLGKQLNFDDERSKLFFEYLRLLRELKPTYFLLENVKMDSQSKEAITEMVGYNPLFINSKIAVPHSRGRLYWTNLQFTPPIKNNQILKDILQDDSEVDSILFATKGQIDLVLKSRHCSLDPKYADCLIRRSFGSKIMTHVTGNSGKIRRLSINECEFLQGVPKDYTNHVKLKDRYEMLGNGWTVPIIKGFFTNIGKKEALERKYISNLLF
jgi:DNA (cytosine-5)-methyltransferase 3A